MKVVRINDILYICNVKVDSRARGIKMRVDANNLNFTAPYQLSDVEIDGFLKRNYDKIIDFLEDKPPVRDNVMHYFGKPYRLVVYHSNSNDIRLVDDCMVVYSECVEPEYLSNLIHEFYKRELMRWVAYNHNRIEDRAQNIYTIEYKFKNVKTYFGECDWNKKIIYFSTRLCKYPEKYIESVLYHELAHLRFHNHDKEFYDYLEKLLPGYKKLHKELKSIKYNDIYD